MRKQSALLHGRGVGEMRIPQTVSLETDAAGSDTAFTRTAGGSSMPRFIQISATFLNIDTIERIDDGLEPPGCTLALRNGTRIRVEENAHQVITKLAEAVRGLLPLLTHADGSPRIF